MLKLCTKNINCFHSLEKIFLVGNKNDSIVDGLILLALFLSACMSILESNAMIYVC